jgi:hypothetical protein
MVFFVNLLDDTLADWLHHLIPVRLRRRLSLGILPCHRTTCWASPSQTSLHLH